MPKRVEGQGPYSSKLMIVYECPDKAAEESGIIGSGKAGELLDGILGEAGIKRQDCWQTYVSKYRPPQENFKNLHKIGIQLDEQIKSLFLEIHRLKPNCILALGEESLKAITGKSGISKYRGSILTTRDGTPKVVSTIHPINLVSRAAEHEEDGSFTDTRKAWPAIWRHVIVFDAKRALEESLTSALNLPDRYLHVAKNALDVKKFLDRHKHLSIATEDIESMHCHPVCTAIAFNKHESMSIPLYNRVLTKVKQKKRKNSKTLLTSQEYTEVRLANYTDSDKRYIWQLIDDFHRTPGRKLIGQNWKYDEDKLRMVRFSFPNPLYADTLLGAHTINPEMPAKSQGFLTSTFTREPFYKDEGREFHPKKDDISRLFLYNAKDAAVDFEIWEEEDKELDYLSELYHINLREFYYNYVVRLHDLYSSLERRGLRVDETARDYLKHKYTTWHENIQQRFLANLGHPLNVSSPKQVPFVVYEELKCPQPGDWRKKNKCDDTIIANLLNKSLRDEVKEVLTDISEDRRVRKTISTYVMANSDYDGRMRSQYRITGTETSRSSTSILEPPVRPEKCGIAYQTLTKHGDIGQDIGLMLIADEGHIFVKIDLSQAEARVVAVLSDDMVLLDAFNRVDVHRRTAGLAFEYIDSLELDSIICSVPKVDEFPKDGPERFIGKKTRHASNYDMQAREFMSNVNSDARRFHIDFKLSEYAAGKIIDRFHAASPNVRGKFHIGVQEALDSSRVLINPFGRPRIFHGRWGRQLFKEAYAQIPQSTVHDRLCQSWLELEKEKMTDIKTYMEGHDSLTFQMKPDEVQDRCKVIRKVFEQPIDFNNCTLKRDVKLIIPCDFEQAENLADWQKLKVA